MLKILRSVIAFHKEALHEYDESSRDNFERRAFASGDFKGIRFTRLKSGEYENPQLQSAWLEWVAEQDWANRQV